MIVRNKNIPSFDCRAQKLVLTVQKLSTTPNLLKIGKNYLANERLHKRMYNNMF